MGEESKASHSGLTVSSDDSAREGIEQVALSAAYCKGEVR